MVRVAVYTVTKNCKTCISFIYQEIQSLCFSIVSNLFAITKLPHCEFESCSGDMYSIQHYVIKYVSGLQQVCGFLRVLRFDRHDITEILLNPTPLKFVSIPFYYTCYLINGWISQHSILFLPFIYC